MKAVVIRAYGGPEVLKYEEFPDPTPGAGQVLIRVAAASINPVDTFERSGQTKQYRPVELPGVLGWDLAGTVVALGRDVKQFKVGDAVFAWAYHTYAELCAVDAHLLANVPQGLDLASAAALPLVTMTGSQLVSVAAAVVTGQTVLVSGALGSVGRTAVFSAKRLGARVIAGVRGKDLDAARAIGADDVLAIDDEAALKRIGPVDAVANTVRGHTAEQLLTLVKPGGVFASVVGPPGNAKQYPSTRVVAYVSKQDAQGMETIARAVAAGDLAIPVDRRLPLKDASAGHAAIERGGVAGKILLTP